MKLLDERETQSVINKAVQSAPSGISKTDIEIFATLIITEVEKIINGHFWQDDYK